jgi:transposase-like protein
MKESEETKKQRCPDCGSTDTVRDGFNLTKKWGNKARRKCKRCATTFYEKTEVEK